MSSERLKKAPKSYTTVEFRNNLGDALARAAVGDEIIHISHHKREYAAVVPHKAAQFLEAALQVSGKKVLTPEALMEVLNDEHRLNKLRDRLSEIGKKDRNSTQIFPDKNK